MTIAPWQHAAISFLMRPTSEFEKIVDQAQVALGWHDKSKCKNSVISIHVQYNDKGSEAPLVPYPVYLEEVDRWWNQIGRKQKQSFSCISLASDDTNLKETFKTSQISKSQNDVESLSKTFYCGNMMLELFLLTRGNALSFTFSSNFGQLAMHMNKRHLALHNGKDAMPSLIPVDFYYHAMGFGNFFVVKS